MAPATRSHGRPRRAAKKSKAPAGKSRGSQKGTGRQRVPCPECGEPQAKGAGLASHMRAKHPPAVDQSPQVEPGDDTTPPPDRVVPSTPDGLSENARGLWCAIVNVYDLRPDELRVLEDACREAQLIDRLERDISDVVPLIVKGSMGQPVANPLVSEIRQHRATLAGLFRKLDLPDEHVSSDSPAERSVKARAAANARWRRGP